MFDETVFNRIAANLAELNNSVKELNKTLKQTQCGEASVSIKMEDVKEDSLTSLLRSIEKLRDTKPTDAVSKTPYRVVPMSPPEDDPIPYWTPRGWMSTNINKDI